MKLYRVWFLWNNRGASYYTHVLGADVPASMSIADLMQGFWINDYSHGMGVKIVTDDSGTMFVPPGRITGIVRRTE